MFELCAVLFKFICHVILAFSFLARPSDALTFGCSDLSVHNT
jgi:hypothetical protein